MKPRTDLTQEELKSVIHYDPDTGKFTWLDRYDLKPNARAMLSWKQAGGKGRDGRLSITVFNVRYMANRLAWLYMTGEWPDGLIDHINHDPSDDRFCNLRVATQAENLWNRGASKRSSTGCKGVFWNKKGGFWFSTIGVNYKQIYLGRFTTKEAAAKAYSDAAAKYHGEFARAA